MYSFSHQRTSGLRKWPVAIGLSLALCMAAPAARADEFAVVAASDPAYAQLATLARAGWLDGTDANSHTSPRDATLTRYEISIEVARAIFAVTAREAADPAWQATASKNAARALRDLAGSFRGELKGLGVDATGEQKKLDAILRSQPQPIRRAQPNPAVTAPLPRVIAAPSAPLMPISQRLRVSTAVFALTRDADDLFGDEAFGVSSGLARRTTISVPGAIPARADLALGVTDWLTLRANYADERLVTPPAIPSLLERSAAANLGHETKAWRGGVDISLRNNLVLSSDVENISGDRAGAASWDRMGGGVGWTGWQNRLSLKANMSRLVPDDAQILSPSTLVGLNVGLNVSDRLSLSLLYQEMFSTPTVSDPNRLVAGGVSINF